MAEETSIVPVSEELPGFEIPADVQLATTTGDDALAVSKSGDFLPRLQIMGSNTDLVKDGKVAMGVHALIFTQEQFQELGKEISFLSITFRTKALRIPKDGGNPISYFDRSSENFKKVMADAQIADSGCMYGPEFLVWLPTPGCFATYFFGTKTGRRAAPALLTLMESGEQDGKKLYGPKQATSKVTLIKTPKYSWHGPVILPCSTPLPSPGEDFSMTIRDVVEKFKNPPESQVEVAEAPANSRVR